MGYSAMLLLPSIMLFPFTAVAAGAAYWCVRRLRLTPAGVPGFVSYALIGCMSYGVFYLYVTVDTLIYRPARLQRDYVGEVYGTPLSLRSFEQWGFQDPNSEWRYALSPEDLAFLSKRCKSRYRAGNVERCVLFSDGDERWIASVELEGSELRISDGLW
jgi:hypothetical protein